MAAAYNYIINKTFTCFNAKFKTKNIDDVLKSEDFVC